MTPVDEAVERVKELIACIRSNAEENNAHLNDKWVTTIHAHTTVLLEDLLPDLRALLSALELGRQAQQSPAGLGLHPSALQEPSGADGDFRADHFAGILCQVLDWLAALISQSLSRPHDQAWAEAKAEYDKWSSRAKAALSASTTDSGKGRLKPYVGRSPGYCGTCGAMWDEQHSPTCVPAPPTGEGGGL